MALIKLLSSFHTWSNNKIARRFPKFSLYYYTKPRAWFSRRQHPVHGLLNGWTLSSSTKESVLFFTVHKSATSFMSGYLGEVAKAAGLTFIDYAMYFHGMGQEGLKRQQEVAQLKNVFNNRGYFYGPLRYFIPVRAIETYRIVLLVRDPRDILTSQYFSIRNSHPLITERMIERNVAAQQMTIDEHVRSQADRFLQTFQTYANHLLNRENVLLLRYEDMIRNFPDFLNSVNQHCHLDLTYDQLRKLDRADAFKVDSEKQDQHKRKVVSGDHKEKLQPETIAWLNEKFGKVLTQFGYTV